MIPLACAAYNFFPNEHSKESPFFLRFGRDPIVSLNFLFEYLGYLGIDENILSLKALRHVNQTVVTNLELTGEKRDTKVIQYYIGIMQLMNVTLGILVIVKLCLSLERLKL